MSNETTPRKKSEKRQRDAQIKLRCTAAEFNAIAAKADAAGLSVAAYLRAAATGTTGPRAQKRLPADAVLLRQVLAQLGKYGSNMNQIAYQLNAHGAQGLEADFRAALGEWAEIRDSLLDALGLAPEAKTPAAQPTSSRFIPARK